MAASKRRTPTIKSPPGVIGMTYGFKTLMDKAEADRKIRREEYTNRQLNNNPRYTKILEEARDELIQWEERMKSIVPRTSKNKGKQKRDYMKRGESRRYLGNLDRG